MKSAIMKPSKSASPKAKYSRIHRLLKIITLVQSEPGWTPKRLALECKTVERTIYRDMNEIIAAGVPIYYDPEKHQYYVGKDFYLPPVDLTYTETMALVTLGLYLREEEQIPFTQAAVSALAKIRGKLPSKIVQQLADVEKHMQVKLAAYASQDGVKDLYALMQKAVATRTCLECQYQSPASNGDPAKAEETFTFKPYALFFNQRAWYVIGHHSGRNNVRTLKLNRFAAVEPTKQRYEIPASFSLDSHHGNAWRMIRGKDSYKVELLFDPEFAETISDTVWHKTQEFEHQPDGSLLFRCNVDGLSEIKWWILSMGCHCKVIGPKELIHEMKTELDKARANY